MKFTTTIFVSAAYLAALVSAQSGGAIVSITSPLSNTKYKAGQEAIISWINPTVSTIPQIVLAKGPSTALQPIMTIATNVNAADMKYVWKIPLEVESGTEYAFELGTSPNLAFAGPFTIEGGVGGTLPASSSNATSGSTNSSTSGGSAVAAAPVSPAGNNNAATPAAPSTTGSMTSPHNASASHSAASKQTVGQAFAALGMAAAIASQFF